MGPNFKVENLENKSTEFLLKKYVVGCTVGELNKRTRARKTDKKMSASNPCSGHRGKEASAFIARFVSNVFRESINQVCDFTVRNLVS